MFYSDFFVKSGAHNGKQLRVIKSYNSKFSIENHLFSYTFCFAFVFPGICNGSDGIHICFQMLGEFGY